MNLLTLIAAFNTNDLLGLLLFVAIACVVLWAIQALIKWAGWTIPTPVRIIFIALLCIVLIIYLFKIFGLLT